MIDLTGYKLTFDDEFSNLSVSQSGQNTVWADIRPDWRLNPDADIGFGDSAFVDPASGIDPFSIQNGALNIQAVQTSNPVVGPGSWASGLLETQNSFSQEYGYFEIRAQLPAATGVWPAFWMMPENDSWPPEVDVFEAYGTSDLYQTVHTGVTGSDTYQTTWSNQPSMLSGFHTYGVLWTPGTITFTFDGKAIGEQSTPTDLHQPMYLLVNLAMQAIAGVTSDPKSMQIDYVRAYSDDPNATAVPLGTVSSPDGLDTADLYGATAAPTTQSLNSSAGTTIVYGMVGDVVEDASGNVYFTFTAGPNPVVLDLSGGATIYAGENDTLTGGAGTATVIGAAGDDFMLGNGTDTVNAIAADESVTFGTGNATIYGGSGDTIGDAAGTVVTFDGGSNVIVLAGAGNSILLYSGPGDTLVGGSAAATVIGATGDDLILGSGADTVNAFPGNETVELGAGANETIFGGTGDTIEAAGGSPIVTFEAGAQGIVFTETAGADGLTSGPGDSLLIGAGSLDIIGAAGNTLTLGAGTDTVNALPPNESVTFGSGNATVFGGDGDTIGTAAGTNVVFNAGNSIIIVTEAGGAVTVDDGAGDTITVGNVAATIVGASNSSITLGAANDTVRGANGDTITTGAGSNAIDLGASHTAPEFLAPGSGDNTGANDTVVNFNEALGDRILEQGAAETHTLGSATSSGGNTTITLSDGSKLSLVGINSIDSSFFA